MKKLALVLAALMLVALAIPAAAEENYTVLYGTPVVDGVLDEMYLPSAQTEIENIAFWTDNPPSEDTAAEGSMAYLLYDNGYIYICAVINDNSRSDVYDESIDYTWWNTNDNIENYLYNADNTMGGQIHVNALGYGLRTDLNGAPIDKPNPNNQIDVAGITVKGVMTDTGYVVEMAVPVDGLVVPEAGNVFFYSLQWNDYFYDEGSYMPSGIGNDFGAAIEMTLSAEKAPAPAADDTTTNDETVDDGAAEDDTAAQTFDAGVIAAVAAIVSAAGYAISKKR